MSRPTFMGHYPVLDGIRGVAVLAVCGFNFHWGVLRGGFPAVSIGVAAVMLRWMQHPCGGLASALSHPVLTWFGRISYSLYLWHLPVGSLLRAERLGKIGVPDSVTPGVQVVVSVLLAALSYTFVERSVLRRGRQRIQTSTNP